MTAESIFNLAMDLMRKRSVSGAIDGQKTASYRAAAPGLLTLWQNENAKLGNLFSIVEFSNTPYPNILGDHSEMDIKEYMAEEDLTIEALLPTRAYYFEVDGPGTVFVEDFNGVWNELAEITVPDTVTSFTGYKGIVTPSANATRSRLRFTGGTYYRTINRALFSIPFATGRVPDYRPWVKKTMPADFSGRDQIIDEYPDGRYEPDPATKWEGRGDLYISYWFAGKIRIRYVPVPTAITALTQAIQLDDSMAISGAYFLAAHLLLVEDPDSANFFSERYEEYRMINKPKPKASVSQIVDVYGGPC